MIASNARVSVCLCVCVCAFVKRTAKGNFEQKLLAFAQFIQCQPIDDPFYGEK